MNLSMEQEIDLLAKTIYGEARGESFLGKIAVGFVPMNRLAAGGRFGNTLYDVILRPKQFSCWNMEDVNLKAIAMAFDSASMAQCRAAAVIAYFGLQEDPTKGSDHYHGSWMPQPPSWAKEMTFKVAVGSHLFYKD